MDVVNARLEQSRKDEVKSLKLVEDKSDLKPSGIPGVESFFDQETIQRGISRGSHAVSVSRYHKEGRRTLNDDYEVENKVLGKGWNGSVLQASCRATGRKYALKRLRLKGRSRRALQQEVEIYLSVDHPNIAKLVDVYETSSETALVMEHCSGGELYGRLAQRVRYTESCAAEVTQQMLRAVNYLHTSLIVHRDIKLENWLYESPTEDAYLKLIDFGFAKQWDPDQPMMACCGSLSYVSPEVLGQKGYSNKCDMWSVGVVVFMLLSGALPFNGSVEFTREQIKRGEPAWVHLSRGRISKAARGFVSRLLNKDPERRPCASEAMKDPWITRNNQEHREVVKIAPEVLGSLRHYSGYSLVRRAALQLLAQELTAEETRDLRELFLTMDTTNKGSVSFEELRQGLAKMTAGQDDGARAESLGEIVQEHEASCDDCIRFSDFLAATLRVQENLREDAIQRAFHRLDADHSGTISPHDLKEAIGEDFEGVETEKLFEHGKEGDLSLDDNGELGYDAFVILALSV